MDDLSAASNFPRRGRVEGNPDTEKIEERLIMVIIVLVGTAILITVLLDNLICRWHLELIHSHLN